MFGRMISTLILFGVWSVIGFAFNAPATLVTGQMAGRQFESSDQSYLISSFVINAFSGTGLAISVLFLLAMLGIWWKPIKAAIAAMALTLLALMLSPDRAGAYYDTTDYNESYFILPNESAFFIPDAGDNKGAQAKFGSAEYLESNRIAAKRFQIPHSKLTNSGLFSNYYVPSGRLIVVDRTQYSREWVAQAHRGTSNKDESFPCQSKEGLDISVGIAIGAEVTEDNVSKFLYHFGVNPPAGDRSDPKVIFTSVFYGKSLTQVMDGPVRSKIQSLVCNEFTKRSFDTANGDANAIMTAIEASASAYMGTVGITMDYVGWADTFSFEKPIQDALNRRYVASQDAEIAKSLGPNTSVLQALASAEATRTMAQKWDGKAPQTVSLWWLPQGVSDFMTRMLSPVQAAPAK